MLVVPPCAWGTPKMLPTCCQAVLHQGPHLPWKWVGVRLSERVTAPLAWSSGAGAVLLPGQARAGASGCPPRVGRGYCWLLNTSAHTFCNPTFLFFFLIYIKKIYKYIYFFIYIMLPSQLPPPQVAELDGASTAQREQGQRQRRRGTVPVVVAHIHPLLAPLLTGSPDTLQHEAPYSI